MHELRAQFHWVAVMLLRKNPAAQPFARFQHEYIHARGSKALPRSQPGNPRANNNHIRCRTLHRVDVATRGLVPFWAVGIG